MTTDPSVRAVNDPEGQLERAFIEEFLRRHDLDFAALHKLPEEQARHLLAEASTYAASRLAEIDARAHFVHDIHRQEG